MARVDAAGWLQKWGQRLNASQQYIKDGVNGVKTAPGKAAAAAQDLMLQRITEAITSGKWAKQVSSVSLADWQSAMINKGIPRIAQGVTSAQNNKTAIIAKLLDTVDKAAAAAHALPKGDITQSIARAAAFMTYMSENAPKKSV